MNRPLILLIFMLPSLVACSSQPNKPSYSDHEPDLEQSAKLNIQLGVGYMKRGQYKVAREKLEKAIEQDPDNIDAYSTLALLMKLLGENDAADDYFTQALDIDEKNAELRNSYGAFLCSVGRAEEGLDQLQRAYNDPFYDTAYMAKSNAGSCLMQQKKYTEAEKMLRAALRKDPKLSGALFSMAELGLETERYLMARAYIQRYHAVSRSSAKSLWIQVQAEKGLNAEDHFKRYAEQLLKEYPDSDEAALVQGMMNDGR